MTTAPDKWRPPSMIENPAVRYGLWAIAGIYVVWSLSTLEIDWVRTAKGFPRAGDMIARMFPPSFERWQLLVDGVVESLQMAFAASLIGMILAVPLGLCAASNLAPRPVYFVARGIIVLSRTFHEVIVAIFVTVR